VFDLGWSEMAIIMQVALVHIGPKDLPRLARSVAQWVAKGRAMARDLQRSLEEMAREAELDDVKREIEKVGRTNIS
jgi:sec-independent protein translocase protein TatB